MRDEVKTYYGSVLQSSADLQTTACCTDAPPPAHLRAALARVHPEVRARYYGCGLVAPPVLEGARVLDLGCGSGQDIYVLSQLVGPEGSVVGVDMTEEQLAVARAYQDYHAEAFGHPGSNVEFIHGYLEQLDELGLAPESFDVIISNCVINLVQDKAAVLAAAYRLLKPGGEFYFSDVYADRRVPEAIATDPVLYGECLGGALYWNDFLNLARAAGFVDPRLVEDRRLGVDNPELEARLGAVRFYSATYRLFRIPGLEPDCEDYGQAVRYRGTIAEHPEVFVLDKGHRFETDRVVPVCGNTARMLAESRLADHFDCYGEATTHFGIFTGCGGGLPFDDGPAPVESESDAGGCCG